MPPIIDIVGAAKLFFAPLRERWFRPVLAVIILGSAVMAWIEVYKPFN